MSLPFVLGALTLTPTLCALLIALLGVVRYALKPLVLVLGLVGLLVPIVLLLILFPELSSGNPLFISLFGGSAGVDNWFSAVYRIDGFGLYTAFGISVVVAPLLLWMAWKGGAAVETSAELPVADEPDEADEADEDAEAQTTSSPSWLTSRLVGAQWGGVALALVIETAALTLVLADNIAWLALSWLVLVALVWGIGELGSDLDTVDRIGLGLMLIGPVLWVLAMLIPATGQGANRTIYPRLTDMMGRNGLTPLHVLVLAVALTLAGAGYPFMVWLRRRALLVTPAGLAALVIVLLPAALIVGARTYSAAQNANSSWQTIGQTTPPITAGVWFALLGMLTICISGLLALGRRDNRTLIAFLAIAQVGWGLLALGAGNPTSMLGLMTLLATALFGLGAMLSALFAGGTLTSDIEPDGAGPRAFDVPVQPLMLAGWIIGGLTLLGAPLFGGFVARQIISASILQARGLMVPLVGISWAGDALLGLALLRATAPAFTVLLHNLSGTLEEDASEAAAPRSRMATLLPQIPAALLGLLALLSGALPQILLNVGALPAASVLVQAGTANTAFTAKTFGYLLVAGQWVPGVAWVAIIVLTLLILFALPSSLREIRPVYLAGAAEPQAVQAVQATQLADATNAGAEEAPDTVENVSVELAYLPEPTETWSDIAGAFTAPWFLPLNTTLLRGVDDEISTVDESDELEEEEDEQPEEEIASETDEDEQSEIVADEDVEEVDEEEVAETDEEELGPEETAGAEEVPVAVDSEELSSGDTAGAAEEAGLAEHEIALPVGSDVAAEPEDTAEEEVTPPDETETSVQAVEEVESQPETPVATQVETVASDVTSEPAVIDEVEPADQATTVAAVSEIMPVEEDSEDTEAVDTEVPEYADKSSDEAEEEEAGTTADIATAVSSNTAPAAQTSGANNAKVAMNNGKAGNMPARPQNQPRPQRKKTGVKAGAKKGNRGGKR